MGIPSADPCS